MPRLPRLTVPVLSDLASQLRYAPREALLKAIERVEALAIDLDPASRYPADWVTFRLTLFRSESARAADLVSGDVLLADLSALCERLCAAADLREDELSAEEGFVPVDDVADAWNVSRKTVDRYRRRGLVARRVIGSNDKPRLVVSRRSASSFRAAHHEEIDRAASYSRIDEITQRRMLRRAERYRRRFGCSLNAAALRLAERFDRSHEAVRQVLRRGFRNAPSKIGRAARVGSRSRSVPAHRRSGEHDSVGDSEPTRSSSESLVAPRSTQATSPASHEPSPFASQTPQISSRERRVAYRAWKRAIEPALIAQRLGHSKPSIFRAIGLERADALRGISGHLDGVVGKGFDRADAAERLLAAEPVRRFDASPGEPMLVGLLHAAGVRSVVVGVEELSRSTAYHFLLWRAKSAIERLNRSHPSARALDRIETDLRWAARLRTQLVRSHLPLISQTLASVLGRPIERLRPAEAASLMLDAIRAAGDAVHAFDPFRARETGARLAGAISPLVTRQAAQVVRTMKLIGERQAAPIFSMDRPIDDWTRAIAPWQALVEPDARVRRAIGNVFGGAVRAGSQSDGSTSAIEPPLDAPGPVEPLQPPASLRDAGLSLQDRDLLIERFGWRGRPPLTLDELRAPLARTPMQIAVMERKAIRAAMRIARG